MISSNFVKVATEESRERWEALADTWDEKMGEHSNRWHRELIRPATAKLLNIQKDDTILDIACGNGNFSRFMAEQGARVTAFDYSAAMIRHARERCREYQPHIDFHVVDATKFDEIMALRQGSPFDKAVSNMAVMDISDIEPLFRAVHDLLKPGGVFVFSGVHPCFQTPGMKKFVETDDYRPSVQVRMGIQTYEYKEPRSHETLVFLNVDKPVLHYHRPLGLLLNTCFTAGFVMDGLEEPTFVKEENATVFDWYDIPPAIIVRLRKPG